MSLTASMSVSPTTVSSGNPVTVTLTVSNSSGSPIKLQEVRHNPQGMQRMTDDLSELAATVPANGSITCSYEVRPYRDNQTIAAIIFGSDGSVDNTANASVTVT